MRKLILFLIVIAAAINISSTSAETGKAGQAGAFLKFGLGARALGMGGAFCSIAEGIDAVYYNPAGLAFAATKQVGFTYHSLSLDRNLNSAAFIFPVRNEAVMGLSWINSSVSNVTMVDYDRNPFGEFKNSNNAFGLTFAKIFGVKYAFGGNLRYLQSTLGELDTYAIGVDIGGYCRLNKMFTIGLTAQDLGSEYRWDSSNYWSSGGNVYNDKFPVKIRGGTSATLLNEALTAALDIVKIQYLDLKIYAGAEYWIFKQVSITVPDEESEDEFIEKLINKRLLGLRTGYSDGSLTFGMSLYNPFGKLTGGFDYAFLTGKRGQESNHIFTVRIMF